MKFLCDEALNSAIIRDHIDQCASLSADLQQKLRSLNSELKVLKLREEFFTADLAKVKNNVGHGGDSGSNAFTSGGVSDGKLNGQVSESGAQSLSACFRQLDNGGQMNELMDNSKQPRSYTSKDNLEETCATSVNQLKSTDTVNNLQYQPAVKDKCQQDNYCPMQSITQVARLQNELVQGNVCSNVDFQQESPESSSNSFPSTAHVLLDHNSTGSLSSNCVNQSSNPGDVSFSQAFNLQLASLKSEIRSLQDSIALKESELYKVSIRKEFLGRDSEGRPYWILGRSGSCLQIVANAGVSAQQRLSPNFCHSGMDNSRQFGVLDWYASGDNVSIPNFCQWTTYQSDEEVKELLEWLRDNDTRERELKESILQWVSYKSKHSNFADGLIQKKKELSSSDSSKGRKVSDSDFLVTKAMTVLSKKFGSCKEMDVTEVCKNPGLPVKVPCKGGIYRCLCLEPLWISRPHCYSCHQTFSNAEELAQHASDKCKSNSELHESSQIMENSSKRKKVTRSETCQEKSLGSNGINQASKSRKQGSVPAFRNEKHSSESASVEHQDQPECPFKFEEIKRKFIVQSSLKEEIKKIGLIGLNGAPSFIPCRSSYLDYPVGLFHTTEDEVATETTIVVETCQQQSNTAPSFPGKIHILDNPLSNENGIFDDELELGRGRSTVLNEKNQLSSMKVKSQALGINKSFTVRESSVRPLIGRDFEILRRLKINLLDMDAALPEEALRASRSHSDRRCSWRAFVKSAATVYEVSFPLFLSYLINLLKHKQASVAIGRNSVSNRKELTQKIIALVKCCTSFNIP